MTLDEINQELAKLAASGDEQFANAAMYVQDVVRQLHTGDVSPSEAQEVLGDVQQQLAIIQSMEQMAFKETLNTVINGVIALASAM
jgi:polyhydroxyalkanoate synthesis regulator phasin